MLSEQPGRSGWRKCGAKRRERSHAQAAQRTSMESTHHLQRTLRAGDPSVLCNVA
ncbi:hypothetical protein ATPR_3488 [Acetobacter tropicalis NBRC 101654]|uniref:Uncharacterized protein n=1 Tax=Acetobacter tropicalis NBRC 101654 TaxID=749388 RepID=F7VJD9_9PROT|nr:hypothetical protein ATPR_3488 [Acetobacter tropicalis NBRC 101654]